MSLPIPSTSGTALDPKQLQALDAPLIALTNQCGGDLRRLMFAFFSFLHRRTDFYLVPHQDDVQNGATMGFREGDAEKMLIAAFRQFPLRKIPKRGAPAPKAAKASSPPKPAPPNVKETKAKKANPSSSPPPRVEKKEVVAKEKEEKKESKEGNLSGVEYNEEGLQIPVGNGGSTKQYKWTQTIDECSVLIGVPQGLRGKDLDIKLTSNTLAVKTKRPLEGEDKPRVFVEGKMTEKIRADESTWSLEGGVVIITLDKLKKTFWSTILEGDEKIDTELVDSRRHINEYDDATQGQIRKIIFDQNQYHKGLPSSDEILGQDKKIPSMPPGVEYIDQTKLDEMEKKAPTSDKKTAGGDGESKQKYTIDLDKK